MEAAGRSVAVKQVCDVRGDLVVEGFVSEEEFFLTGSTVGLKASGVSGGWG